MEPIRTWNLSGQSRSQNHGGGEAWSKTINPVFYAREGEGIALLGSARLRRPHPGTDRLGSDPKRCRLLLDHVAGEDLHPVRRGGRRRGAGALAVRLPALVEE
ncbi:hypothetical protein ACFWBC_15470 [Streptomyces sp. NPDC059985]|uniref:hypothetical protein n=1 Tax=Streptomyces sp. NPDC059985 TaxID=3347025 RepID=UPI0036B33F5C